jgi:hypothetical protein
MKSSRMRAKTNNAKTATKLLVAMTGKASPAKAAEGDEPVFAYIASLPQPQRSVASPVLMCDGCDHQRPGRSQG